ncbi:bifunctional diguanylate cyclase/phosphodiesterase [Billgrantia endophytica]|uniref:cyclic-guanylate-specific phosphodiesterase n=1 Tax=Billgrantia endophytica TaxID=2033802 RepID=A0A2N7UB76_9GAMM|nr:EAL domain-containing protein [Halomonas endophytica]PMR77693.1 hypothetical protein C1H69_01560 [Halomonas endophytica]
MPNNTQQVALHTWLIMVPVLLIVMGLINGLAAWQLATAWKPSLVSMPLLVLAGMGLLSVTFGRMVFARLCGGLLVLFCLLAALAAHMPGVPIPWPLPIRVATGVAIFCVAVCLLAGAGSERVRWLWVMLGFVLTLLGGLGVVGDIWPDTTLHDRLGGSFNSAFTALPALLCGTAMLLHGFLPPLRRAEIPRVVLVALLCGSLASVLTWYGLSWQHYDDQRRQGAELLANFKTSSEQVVGSSQLLLQRMAERWTHLGGLPEAGFRELELATYFRDTPSLVSFYWQNSEERFHWGVDRDTSLVLPHWVQQEDGWLMDWLAVGGLAPRWVLPDPARPGLALVSVPLGRGQESRLVGVVDLGRLLSEEVRTIVSPLALTVHRDSHLLFSNRGGKDELGHQLATTGIVLPGGVTLEARGYAPASVAPTLGGLVPLGVAVGGLTLTYLLAFSLGVTGLSSRRSLMLAQAQRHRRAQQRVQAMVARDRPLPETLRAICRLVEFQSPGALSSIMLCDRQQRTLDRAFSTSLPASYLDKVSGARIDPASSACGRAAYQRDFVICRDIATDPLWAGFREVAEAHGLRACWSCPVMASNGRVLGTFAIYYRQPGEPSRGDRRRLVEAAELASLAVEREENRQALHENEQRYSSLFTYHPDAVFSLDLSGRFISANAACSKLTEYPLDRLIGMHVRALFDEEDREQVENRFSSSLQGEALRYSVEVKRRSGEAVSVDLTHLPIIIDGEVVGVYGIAKDTTERKAYEAQLAFHASHDDLTGLANRALFEERLVHDVQLARRHERQLAVLFIDLDDFKPINDSLGHEVGDQVLKQVGQRLAEELAPGDTLARFGGDEFIVLLPELSYERAALELAERLILCVGRPYCVEGHELYIGASVGVAFLVEALASPLELIQQADMAMYRAKQQGRNTWQCFTSEINEDVSSRMALRNDLQEAIEAENFELHYQPLLNVADGSVEGVEALVRWHHPDKGYLTPALFIPLSEETGQIGPISERVLRKACRDMYQLEKEGLGRLRVSVNLSPLQFHRPNFLANLRQTLRETGLDATCLELELTEGILMSDTIGAIETLQALRNMGVEVSIDDFGTGFSSLSYLKQLPINKIKIDRSFIHDVTTNPHDSAIVQGIISMAHHLGVRVVAEGIEESEQRDFLLEHGCDVFQGYFFARPMPLDQLKAYLVRRPRKVSGMKKPLMPVDR